MRRPIGRGRGAGEQGETPRGPLWRLPVALALRRARRRQASEAPPQVHVHGGSITLSPRLHLALSFATIARAAAGARPPEPREPPHAPRPTPMLRIIERHLLLRVVQAPGVAGRAEAAPDLRALSAPREKRPAVIADIARRSPIHALPAADPDLTPRAIRPRPAPPAPRTAPLHGDPAMPWPMPVAEAAHRAPPAARRLRPAPGVSEPEARLPQSRPRHSISPGIARRRSGRITDAVERLELARSAHRQRPQPATGLPPASAPERLLALRTAAPPLAPAPREHSPQRRAPAAPLVWRAAAPPPATGPQQPPHHPARAQPAPPPLDIDALGRRLMKQIETRVRIEHERRGRR